MSETVGLLPPALPDFLVAQLDEHNFKPGDAALCASMLTDPVNRTQTASLFVDLGSCKFLDGDIDGAIAAWRHAMTADRSRAGAGALLNLGLLFEHLALHEQALSVLAAVDDRDDHTFSHDAALATARCQRALGDTDAAMETMARRAQITMRDAPESSQLTDTLYAFGVIAAGAHRLDRAERAWRAALVAEPSPSQQAAHASLVGLLLERGHDDALIDVLETNEAIDPAHLPAVLERVLTAHRIGNPDQAVALANAISSQGLGATDQFRLVDARLQVGLINEAVDDLELLLNSAEAEVQLRAGFILGEVYRTYDMIEPASAMYERIIDTADSYWSPKAALSMGDIALEAGRVEEAATYWDQAASCAIASIRRRADARFEKLIEPETEAELAAQIPATASPDEVEAAVATEPLPDIDNDDAVQVEAVEPQWAEPQWADEVVMIEVPSLADVQADLPAPTDVEVVEPPAPESDVAVDASSPLAAESETFESETFDPALVIEPPQMAGPPQLAEPQITVPPAPISEPLVIDLAALANNVASTNGVADPAPGHVESIEADPGPASEPVREVDQPQAEPVVVVLSDVEPDIEPPDNVYHLDVARGAASTDGVGDFERLVQEQPASGSVPDPADVDQEPVVIALRQDDESATDSAHPDEPVVIDLNKVDAAPRKPSPFARIIQGDDLEEQWSNPYASLAPSDGGGELVADYVSPSSRNPYAELAPNYEHDDVLVGSDVEPGDWQALLGDEWPGTDPEPSGSFSRYT